MSETDYTAPSKAPFKSNNRADGKDGSVAIVFPDARHLADVLHFAEEHAKEAQFRDTFIALIRVALGYSASRPATVFKGKLPPDFTAEGEMPIPAQEGRTVELRIWPDYGTERTPSFSWSLTVDGKQGLVGGFIHHNDDGRWLLHT